MDTQTTLNVNKSFIRRLRGHTNNSQKSNLVCVSTGIVSRNSRRISKRGKTIDFLKVLPEAKKELIFL